VVNDFENCTAKQFQKNTHCIKNSTAFSHFSFGIVTLKFHRNYTAFWQSSPRPVSLVQLFDLHVVDIHVKHENKELSAEEADRFALSLPDNDSAVQGLRNLTYCKIVL